MARTRVPVMWNAAHDHPNLLPSTCLRSDTRLVALLLLRVGLVSGEKYPKKLKLSVIDIGDFDAVSLSEICVMLHVIHCGCPCVL